MTTGMITALGAIFEGHNPQPQYEIDREVVTVELFEETLEYKVANFSRCFDNMSFRGPHHARAHLTDMKTRIQIVKDHTMRLIGRTDNEEALKAVFTKWAKRHIEHSLAHIRNYQSMASPMVTGPSNFPVRRHQKKLDAERRRMENLRLSKEAVIKRLDKTAFPYGDPSKEIRSDHPDATQLLKQRIDDEKKKREDMKKTNAEVRKALKQSDPKGYLIEQGYSPQIASTFLKADYMGRICPYPPYSLQNLGANIRRLEQRLKELEKVKDRDTTSEEVTLAGETVEIIQNTEENRLQIIFPGKPNADTRQTLKKYGFKWSPKQGAWQRMLNNNALYSLKLVKEALKA